MSHHTLSDKLTDTNEEYDWVWGQFLNMFYVTDVSMNSNQESYCPGAKSDPNGE